MWYSWIYANAWTLDGEGGLRIPEKVLINWTFFVWGEVRVWSDKHTQARGSFHDEWRERTETQREIDLEAKFTVVNFDSRYYHWDVYIVLCTHSVHTESRQIHIRTFQSIHCLFHSESAAVFHTRIGSGNIYLCHNKNQPVIFSAYKIKIYCWSF